MSLSQGLIPGSLEPHEKQLTAILIIKDRTSKKEAEWFSNPRPHAKSAYAVTATPTWQVTRKLSFLSNLSKKNKINRDTQIQSLYLIKFSIYKCMIEYTFPISPGNINFTVWTIPRGIVFLIGISFLKSYRITY